MKNVTPVVEALIKSQNEPQTKIALCLADTVGTVLATMAGHKTGASEISSDEYVSGLGRIVSGSLSELERLAVEAVAHSAYARFAGNKPLLASEQTVKNIYLKMLQPPSDCILAAVSQAALKAA